MKIILFILYFSLTSLGYSQIDYEGLIRNLEEIGAETNLEEFLAELPYTKNDYDEISVKDERFLRFYGVIVDEVNFENGYSGKEMTLSLFDEESDYEVLKAKFNELYGEPEADIRDNRESLEWETETKKIYLSIDKEKGSFKKFSNLRIRFF